MDSIDSIPNYLLDARGRRRSPASISGYKPTKPPATKGRRYPPDPPPVEDIVAVLQACVPLRPGLIAEYSAVRLRGLIIVLWRTGMRISEALALEERDLDRRERKIVIRNGKGGKRRLVLMDDWGWVEFERWLEIRRTLPPGQIFCVLSGSTIGRAMHDSAVRDQFRDVGERAKLRRRFHPHALRHAAATEWWRENIGLMSVMTQLGHAHPGVTIAYLRSIVDTEMLEPIGNRKPPMVMISV